MATTNKTIRKFIARACSRRSPRGLRPQLLVAVLVLAGLGGGCSKPRIAIEIPFEARFDGQPLDCAEAPDGAALTDLRFYVHDVALIESGRRFQVTLTPDAHWQDAHVALIDLEDGSGACLNGSPSMNTTLHGVVDALPTGAAILEFRIGVPAAINHANPVTAPPPRNASIMHWHWRTGYKFMRAGVAFRDDAAWLHLGSARCRGTVVDIQGCDAPNRPAVQLKNFDLENDAVVVDLARVFGPTGLGDGDAWSCESGPEEGHCRLVFAELGLDFATGEVQGPAPAVYSTSVR